MKQQLSPRARMWLRELVEFGQEVRVQAGFSQEFSHVYRVEIGCCHPRWFFPKDLVHPLHQAGLLEWNMQRYVPSPSGRKAVAK